MSLIPEWAPNLHPIVVHFPIALLIVAIVMDVLSLIMSREWWSEKQTTLLYMLGAVSAVAAFLTGRIAADSVWLSAEAQSILSSHSDWALRTALFYAVYAACRIILFNREKVSRVLRYSFIPISLIGVFLIYRTADDGARLVYGYGVGTGNLYEATAPDTTGREDEGPSSSWTTDEQGNWKWEIGVGAADDLRGRFQWLRGSILDLTPVVVTVEDGRQALEFKIINVDNLFIMPSNAGDVQLDLDVNLAELDGHLSLIHHVLDADNYDYLTISSNGEIEQGRIRGVEVEIFDRATSVPGGWIQLRVASSGTHFMGYINRELVVHGHGSALTDGSAGLRLTGSGTVLISGMELNMIDQNE